MAVCFENLMNGIDRSLLSKNRDRWVKVEDIQSSPLLMKFSGDMKSFRYNQTSIWQDLIYSQKSWWG